MNSKTQFTVGAALAGFTLLSHAQPAPSETRGELLYSTHCVACHTTQMHWRNGRQAFDWESLKFQVRRWQGNAGLAWNDADIAEVSRYLNEAIYHYPQINDRVGLASPQKVHVFGWRNIQPRLVVVRVGPYHLLDRVLNSPRLKIEKRSID